MVILTTEHLFNYVIYILLLNIRTAFEFTYEFLNNWCEKHINVLVAG